MDQALDTNGRAVNGEEERKIVGRLLRNSLLVSFFFLAS